MKALYLKYAKSNSFAHNIRLPPDRDESFTKGHPQWIICRAKISEHQHSGIECHSAAVMLERIITTLQSECVLPQRGKKACQKAIGFFTYISLVSSLVAVTEKYFSSFKTPNPN